MEIPVSASREKLEFQTETITLSSIETPVYANEEAIKIPKVKFWKVASVVVKVFNKATNAKVIVNSEYDKNGNLLALDIVSNNFNYTKEYDN